MLLCVFICMFLISDESNGMEANNKKEYQEHVTMPMLIFLIMKRCSLLLQAALLRWLNSQSEEDRRLLSAVTAVQVGRELLNRITGQDKIDAYKVSVCCLQGAL